MSNLDIIRAWKDEQYRLGLQEDEQSLLPANPAGSIELPDALLDAVAGGESDVSLHCLDSVYNSCFSTCTIIQLSLLLHCAVA